MGKKNCLEAILHMTMKLKYFESEKLTKEDLETISKIRDQLTRFAGPEDIDAVKIIKEQLNKKFGVDNIIEALTPDGEDQLIEIIRTTDLLKDMTFNGATEKELWKVVNYLDSVIHDETITLETALLLNNFKGKYQSKK